MIASGNLQTEQRRPIRSAKASICFVSLNNFPLLAGDGRARHIGGAEVQQLYLAQGLRDRGYRVSFITLDHGQRDGDEYDGIRVYKAYSPEAGVRGLRFLHPRWSGLWRAMRRADAQIYYQRTAAIETAQIAAWCGLHGRKFIFALASNANCDPKLPGLGRRERLAYRWALRRTHLIIAQTLDQQLALRQAFACESRLIRSCCRIDSDVSGLPDDDVLERPRVLWVGRFHAVKRLDWCLQLAGQCTDIGFDIVGAANDSARASRQLQKAATLPNVVLRGALQPRELNALYRRCAFLLCTSRFEGFPNTFLEAWSHARPVLSTVDPDRLIATHGLGQVAESVDALRQKLLELLARPDAYRQMAGNALSYVRREHGLPRALREYEGAITALLHAESHLSDSDERPARPA